MESVAREAVTSGIDFQTTGGDLVSNLLYRSILILCAFMLETTVLVYIPCFSFYHI